MDLFDYVKTYGERTFSEEPFGELDNLLLSALAYLPFEDVFQKSEENFSLKSFAKKFFAKERTEEERSFAALGMNAQAVDLLREMQFKKRYAKIEIFGHFLYLDKEKVGQCRIISFRLPDQSVYVAFSGTDLSLVGWKEDFYFSCLTETAGQEASQKYINARFSENTPLLRLGGHSKGGHFAVYAATMAKKKIRERILEIYANDAPGFLKDFTEKKAYQELLPKMRAVVPSASLVGLLLHSKAPKHFVQSTAPLLLQHNLYTWQCEGKQLLREEEQKSKAPVQLLQNIFARWLEEISSEKRKVFFEQVFSLLEKTGKESLLDFQQSPLQSFREVYQQFSFLSAQEKNEIFSLLAVLLRQTQDVLVSHLKKGG